MNSPPTAPPRWLLINAALGFAAWIALAWAPLPTDIVSAGIQRLTLVGPLVAAPLILAMLEPDAGQRRARIAWLAASWLQLPCAALAIAAHYRAPGLEAALLAVPWLLVTLACALYGLARLISRATSSPQAPLTLKTALDRVGPIDALCVDAGLAYVVVGATWMIIARSGVILEAFDPLIVQLTAAHFHFAGFTAPIITGLIGPLIPADRPRARAAFAIAAVAVIAGPPLIGIGISISPLMEVICALILASGLLVLAALMAFVVGPALKNTIAWGLMLIASLSLVLTMALACAYATGEFLGQSWILIPRMAETHGLANVFGFSLCGLIALLLIRSPGQRDPGQRADAQP